MEDNNKNSEVIDLRLLFLKLWHKKKLFALVLFLAFVVGAVYILPVPRYYSTSVSLAPENSGIDATSGTISSLASSFGVDLGQGQSSDAIYPLLYPDVIASSNFIVPLFSIKVKTADGTVNTDYFTYLTKHQKKSPWSVPGDWMKKTLRKILPKKQSSTTAGHGKQQGPNAFCLTEQQTGVVDKIKNNVVCTVDRKTNVISISVTDQDPLVCATIADSVRARLQAFITNYRTSKAKQDVAYYERLTSKAKADYERVRRVYGAYCDANTDVTLQSIRSKQEDLENDMQLKFNAYTAFNTQLQAARANLQKRTPAFTVIQGASVPIKPAGPKRMIAIIGFMFLAFVLATIFFLRKDMLDLIAPQKDTEEKEENNNENNSGNTGNAVNVDTKNND